MTFQRPQYQLPRAAACLVSLLAVGVQPACATLRDKPADVVTLNAGRRVIPAGSEHSHRGDEGVTAIVDGVDRGPLPVELHLDPDRAHTLVLRCPGFADFHGFIQPEVRTRWLVADAFFSIPLLGIPLLVDLVTGAWRGLRVPEWRLDPSMVLAPVALGRTEASTRTPAPKTVQPLFLLLPLADVAPFRQVGDAVRLADVPRLEAELRALVARRCEKGACRTRTPEDRDGTADLTLQATARWLGGVLRMDLSVTRADGTLAGRADLALPSLRVTEPSVLTAAAALLEGATVAQEP